ncbi:ETC complex I subunit [Paracoccus endophyticus]|uniref:ETC complex I subunit n=1 Tax=Paracoccus endophyticus TaxID=2233774 RepID=UPI000DDA9F9F|nr:ETC complex I subunit [Paracoccus endophyticus]
MRVRIYQPARNAMQSGTARSKSWVLDFPPSDQRGIDPLMGWTSSDDTQAQVRLRFATRAEAEAYAKAEGLDYIVIEPNKRGVNVRPRGYGENFATDRRLPWTH